MRALKKAGQVALMGFDVDGVLTDGTLYFGPEGDTIKAFSSLDGHGIKLLMAAGIEVAIISGRRSAALEHRARNLGISHLHMAVEDKLACLNSLLAAKNLSLTQAGYMGDDVVDLEILTACGFSATVADGHSAVKQRVDFVSQFGGGKGAAREVCDLIVKARALNAARPR